MTHLSPFALGATLYLPAIHKDLHQVVMANKISGLRSLVICLEDAVKESDVQYALVCLHNLLKEMEKRGTQVRNRPMLFVRPRTYEMAADLSSWALIEHIDGFVIPKLSLENMTYWRNSLSHEQLTLMPTLESVEIFDPTYALELANTLQKNFNDKILAIRIGGNDLLGGLGLRRPENTTIYDTPMRFLISMLCGILSPRGFYLTAPVFENIQNLDLLKQEISLDLNHGLVGKTAIHPDQIDLINRSFSVKKDDLESASAIVATEAPAVFKYKGIMSEPATHMKWALKTIEWSRWSLN